MKHLLFIALCSVALGCPHIGEGIEDFTVAHQPWGAAVEVTQSSGTIISGELLAVSDSSIIILWSGTVADVPYGRTRSMSFKAAHVRLGSGQRPS